MVMIYKKIFPFSNLQQLSDDEKKMVKGQLKKCQEKVGATDEQIDNLLDGKDTNSDIAKCLAACALEQYTIVRIHVFAKKKKIEHSLQF